MNDKEIWTKGLKKFMGQLLIQLKEFEKSRKHSQRKNGGLWAAYSFSNAPDIIDSAE